MPQMHTIIGPPGTGKTHRIAELTELAAVKYGPEKVAVCSLTRTSAKEASQRVALPDSQVGTLHSFAFHALGQPDIAEAHAREWNEEHAGEYAFGHGKHLDAPYDVYSETEMQQQKTGDQYKQELYQLRVQRVPREAWPGDVLRFAEAWDDFKRQCDYLDFTDLIEHALRDCATLPGAPDFFAIDEAQDFGELEMELVHKWASRTQEAYQVGDYFQQIFSFRGGGNESLKVAEREVLGQSYRIPAAVHRLAVRWMRRTGLPMVEFKPRPEEGAVYRGSVPYKQVHLFCSALMHIIDPAIRANKTVMLMATCGYMLDGLLRFLITEGIPFHNPWRVQNGRWNPLAHAHNKWVYADRVLAFMRPSTAVWGDEARFWTALELKAWAKPLPASMFQPGAKRQIEKLAANTPDTGMAQQMREWFTSSALEHILNQDARWYCSQAETSGQYNRALVSSVVRRYGCALLKEKPLVIIGTIHSLKGSESDVVCLWPDLSPQAMGMSLSLSRMQNRVEREREVARVFYVGVTRAREELHLMPPSSMAAVAW